MSSPSSLPSPNQKIAPLTAKTNAQGHLEIGGCDVPALVTQYGSPLYIIDEVTLREACRQYRGAFLQHYPAESLVIFASKAWNMLAIDAIVHHEGLGIDVVSAGELYTAIRAGADSQNIYFHGNNKSLQDLEMALDYGVTIVADNWQDLNTLAQLAEDKEVHPRVMIRITPGIECHTHEYIRTGHLDSKFGFDPQDVPAVFEFLSKTPVIKAIGIHAHIGSQIFELTPHQDIGPVLVEWFAKGLAFGLEFSELNVGGGLGICYTEQDDPPSIDDWVQTVCDGVVEACREARVSLPKIIAEPGRSLVGSCGVTAYTVGATKVVPEVRTYISVDGGMSDNPRPITYQARYTAVVANKMNHPDQVMVTVAGKHCESGDILLKDVALAPTEPGDILAVYGTGAYNYAMASNYNRIARPAAVLVKNGESQLVLQRESLEDLVRNDRLPLSLQHAGV
jgi:diaminopimelate decarboxylase